ncbi:sodium/glutamate symporter [Fusobacteria bacterium ZRK30]|nr:sodium/glutamate symporter [Fusobacteria bacterium ZRK30]
MQVFQMDNIATLFMAVIVLLVGRFVRSKVGVLRRFFIPVPVIGGVIFAILTLIGHYTNTFEFSFDGTLKSLFMIAFFTTIGFMASFKLLAKGGVQVVIFLVAATTLVILQDIVGISLAKVFGLPPLFGLAAGSIPLTGGHGTSGAFGPLLEQAGAAGATAVAIASATYGLVAGCLIGGPIGKRLMTKFNLKPNEELLKEEHADITDEDQSVDVTEHTFFNAATVIIISMGIGSVLVGWLKTVGITLPIYIGPMLVAAVIRNISDSMKKELNHKEITIIGNTSLSLFLAMALMSMRLWDLAALAVPLVTILLVQTVLMGAFAYFITFNVMGRDYDAAVMACGHCGFGMGATPNAIANMESFTAANYPSFKAFFVIPLVGALFIDFANASIITFFMNMFG